MSRLMLNSTTKLLLTASTGVIIGWQIHSMLPTDSQVPQYLDQAQEKAPVPKTSKVETIETKQKPDHKLQAAIVTEATPKDTDSITDSPHANVESILKFLDDLPDDIGSQSHSKARTIVRELLKENPELDVELLEAMLDIEDEELKQRLKLALWTSSSRRGGDLENWLVGRIDAGDRTAATLQLFELWGLQSRKGVDSVLGQLANNPDPDVISASIKVLSTTLASYPLALSPNQREGVKNQLGQFLTANEENVRQAAVDSLSTFPQDDIPKILLNALNDPSAKVRSSALMTFMRKPFSSADIQDLVIVKVQDSSLSYMERSMLAGVAENLDLSDYQKTLVKGVQSEIEEYFSSLSEEELRALSEDLQ